MTYALQILWIERNRYLPAVFAVAFSALLIAAQGGMLLGFLTQASRPIDRAPAHLWVGSRTMESLGYGHPVPQAWRSRLIAQPEITRTEPYVYAIASWNKPGGGTESCCIIGARLGESAIGAVEALTPELRGALTEPGTVLVNRADCQQLGLPPELGAVAEVAQQRVRVVSHLERYGVGLMPGVFCSLRTAALLLPWLADRPDQAMYLLACCENPGEAPAIAARLQTAYPDMSVLTAEQFSARTKLYWLIKTRAGIALGLAALLGFVVGAVVTSQTLYAATAAALREHAVLRAMGIPRRRIAWLVMEQAFWVGLFGIALALPAALALGQAVVPLNIELRLPAWLLGTTTLVCLLMAMVSGLISLRSLNDVEPAVLLR